MRENIVKLITRKKGNRKEIPAQYYCPKEERFILINDKDIIKQLQDELETLAVAYNNLKKEHSILKKQISEKND